MKLLEQVILIKSYLDVSYELLNFVLMKKATSPVEFPCALLLKITLANSLYLVLAKNKLDESLQP